MILAIGVFASGVIVGAVIVVVLVAYCKVSE